MNDEASVALVASSTRLVLLSNSESLDGALQPLLMGCAAFRLIRSATLRPGLSDADLILVDVGSFSEADCLRLLRQLSDTPTALINVHAEQAPRLLERHPWLKGVFYPGTSRINFSRGINVILDGGDWLPRALMEKLLGRYRQLTQASRVIDDLSVREKQILALAGKGLSNSEIAERLHLSTHTIKSHIHNALSKLGASNRAQGASLVMGHVSEAGI
ncbi:helix-turn-helix transcriptional regulator [Stutzerimonas stutzeri]|uniref:helix-turn-helix transcriptional regulator n=1 Tax=Stutzerimonas stutzeri TaxID=316 RepID=UPI001C2ED1F0|nr:response regulator transcription factor [Stutzerimonas stutzeri]